jgi:predicted RNA binding protein YcfA (HicA-like mRNA interferase family)
VPNLPRLTGKEMVRFLEDQGWRVLRIAGSHHVMEGSGKRTVVPVHGNQTMKIGTLRSILRDADLSPEEFGRRWHGQ